MTRISETLPNFPEGELAILGGLLIDNASIPKVLSSLKPEDFYSTTHRRVYEAIRDLYQSGHPADWATLHEALKAKGALEQVGGPDFLVSLADAVPSAANINHYCETVKDKAERRRMIRACREAETRFFDDDTPLKGGVDTMQGACMSTVSGETGQNRTVWLSDVVKEHCKLLETLAKTKAPVGLFTGFRAMDRAFGGIQRPDLVILCARPSMGKTALATQIALNVARDYPDEFVMFFSLEMAKMDLSARILSGKTGVDVKAIRQGPINQNKLSDLMEGLAQMGEYPVALNDFPNTNPMDVYTQTAAMSVASGREPSLIVVDYLQFMKPTKPQRFREQEVSSCVSDLKRVAKQLNTPVLVLSQLNRKSEERPLKERRPRLADLRESGAIEQDADRILGLFRLGYYADREADDETKAQQYKNHAEVNAMKNRNGPIGIAELHWKPETTTFYDKANFDQYDGYEPSDDDGARLDVF